MVHIRSVPTKTIRSLLLCSVIFLSIGVLILPKTSKFAWPSSYLSQQALKLKRILNLKADDFVRPPPLVGFQDLADIDCSRVFDGKAQNDEFKQPHNRWNVSQIQEDALKDCATFRDIYAVGRYPQPLQEELDFPLAFSILFHKDFDQVLYFLRAIYHPHNAYCLHADIKSNPEIISAARAVANCLPNVFVASKLEDIVYGSYTRLAAEMTCMKDHLKMPVQWKYYLNTVGQMFPLRSNLEIVRLLRHYNNTNDIEGITGYGRAMRRFEMVHFKAFNQQRNEMEIYLTDKRKLPPPYGLEIVKGSALGAYTRDFVKFVLEDKRMEKLLKWSEDMYSSDEYILPSLHYSKKFQAPGGAPHPPSQNCWFHTYANWGAKRCYGKIVRGICVFSTQDVSYLIKTRREFFVNKFYVSYHPAALHCLDKRIYNLTLSQTDVDNDSIKIIDKCISNTSDVSVFKT